jgi:phage tail sheath protein FI
MATVYKTPGVFIEEIPKFPPSIAQVETAIPAFIGYTEKAINTDGTTLQGIPLRVGSMVEYEFYFGGEPGTNVVQVNIDDANNFKTANAKRKYFMYDSLRLFWANGGGDCFIVSLDTYENNAGVPNKTDFTNMLDPANESALMKEDDPTILLFPDAVLLSDSDLKDVQVAALKQCADLSRMDRMTILDTRETDTLGTNFRNGIGVNYLSYGAAYAPWLKVNLPKRVYFSDVKGVIKRNGADVTLKGLIPVSTDPATKTLLNNLIDDTEKAYADVLSISTKTKTLLHGKPSMNDYFQGLVADYTGTPSVGKFKTIVTYLIGEVFQQIDAYIATAGAVLTNPKILAKVKEAANADFKTLFTAVIAIDAEAVANAKTTADYGTVVADQTKLKSTEWGGGFVAGVAASAFMTGATKIENCNLALAQLQKQFDLLNITYRSLIIEQSKIITANYDNELKESLPVYKTILNGVSASIGLMPPSGAIAGIYAMVDRTRGVWKAPANVSLTNVIGPAVTYTKSQLDNLNVDVSAGKSINAIRTFFGKGTLVYGSRTLAGNDNEWRYVPVRRLFIMVEESVKKATEQFVFEPNDANTWVKVQAMIENFLYNIWRQGALQGIKPEHAFYVAVGLNKTMNPIDILEGRMIIEIGMAAVRPAEFIILRFSHKMAES